MMRTDTKIYDDGSKNVGRMEEVPSQSNERQIYNAVKKQRVSPMRGKSIMLSRSGALMDQRNGC